MEIKFTYPDHEVTVDSSGDLTGDVARQMWTMEPMSLKPGESITITRIT